MKKTISDITNEQIIQSARRQRQSVNSRMEVEPWKPRHHHGRGIAAIITIAASLLSFIAGYGIHSKMSQPTTQPLAQVVQVQHDTIMMTETIRDTVYQVNHQPSKWPAPCSVMTSLTPYWPLHDHFSQFICLSLQCLTVFARICK